LRSNIAKVPGPWYSLFTHWRLKAAVLAGRRLHYIHELHQEYGPIVRISPNEVAIADTQAFKIIHSNFPKSDWYIGQTTVPIKAVFNMSNNKEHAARRRLLAKGFTKTNLVRDWEDVVFEYVKLSVRKMIHDAKQSPTGSVDVMKWWTFLTADVSAKSLFGESFGMLELGEVSTQLHIPSFLFPYFCTTFQARIRLEVLSHL
jgi:cytochrome P450